MVEEQERPITPPSEEIPTTPEETPEKAPETPTSVAPPTKEQPPESIAIEQGEVTPEQIQEILKGRYWSVSELAVKMDYSTTWIQMNCKNGRIRAIKPLGHRWRIPESEVQRILKEGIPPLPREEKRPSPTRIEVEPEKVEKVAPHRKEAEEETTEKKGGDYWPLPFPLKSK